MLEQDPATSEAAVAILFKSRTFTAPTTAMRMTTVGRIALSSIDACLVVQPCRAADAVTEEVIKKLSTTQVDRSVLSEILAMPASPELTAALKAAFERQQEPGGKSTLRQLSLNF
ncbi:MAG: hypothetical protein JWO80_4512 [Bryobacterales bacterium]|nr:hypothetical protein [Bryobacterales bacterium]